jgi:hypothetical protein
MFILAHNKALRAVLKIALLFFIEGSGIRDPDPGSGYVIRNGIQSDPG